ncbi:MAG: response regulator [Oligoflexia bacterium]|nr:response regulator [Oligoflexia bacterium]
MGKRYLDNFHFECEEILENCEQILIGILDHSDQRNYISKIHRMFRSIKDMSGMMGFKEINEHTRYISDLLLVVRESGMNRGQYDYFLKQIELIRKFLKSKQIEFKNDYTITEFLNMGKHADDNVKDLAAQETKVMSSGVSSTSSTSSTSSISSTLFAKDNFSEYTNRLPEQHIEIVKNFINCELQGIEIKHNKNFTADYDNNNSPIFFIPFENSNKKIKGIFALDFCDLSTGKFIAESMAKKIGYNGNENIDVSEMELQSDVLVELLNGFIGPTVSDWDRLKLNVEMGNLITNEDISNLPFKGNKIQNSYEITFHTQKGFFRFRIYFTHYKKSAPKRILIVDDSRTVRFALGSGLKKEGFVVEEASSGDEAILKYESFTPDLTIMDLIMPKMSGLEAIAKIKSKDQNAKFVILSAAYKEEDAKVAKSLGVLFFISKPLYMNLIVETINKISINGNDDVKEKVNEKVNNRNSSFPFSANEVSRVLVVDDSKVIRKVVSDSLKLKGIEVTEAINGKDAIAKFKESQGTDKHYEVVIMDLMMPEMNGLDAMKEIRKLDENVKFIVLTSKNKNETDLCALDAVDVSSYINKSFDMNKIYSEVSKISNLSNLSNTSNISNIESAKNYLNNKRILVVNNSKALRHIITCLLRNDGLEVEEASSGVEAVEIYQKFKPILTIIDLSMPFLGGFEIMSQIREINNEARFVILSSRSQSDSDDVSKLFSVIKNALL